QQLLRRPDGAAAASACEGPAPRRPGGGRGEQLVEREAVRADPASAARGRWRGRPGRGRGVVLPHQVPRGRHAREVRHRRGHGGLGDRAAHRHRGRRDRREHRHGLHCSGFHWHLAGPGGGREAAAYGREDDPLLRPGAGRDVSHAAPEPRPAAGLLPR
ncbi:unnamed protein product, partial [Prorocentrum cordatum]